MRLQRTLIGLTFSIAAFAQSSPLGPDVAGGKDIPWLSRFAGSQMIGFQDLDFGQGNFYAPRAGRNPAFEIDTAKPVVAEGIIFRRLYLAPIGKTALEVHRNFEQALRSSGLKVVSSVDGNKASGWDAGEHWSANFSKMTFQPPFAVDISPFNSTGYYLYGTLKRAGSEVSVSVLTGDTSVYTHDTYKAKAQDQLAVVAIQIVEPKPMETGQVTVSADAIGKGLADEGKIALYGIYFDTGKSVLKPESKPQLEQMAALLKQQSTLRVYIVGHTDNQGNVDGNVLLSQQRAQAVTTALSTEHGIDAKRMSAKGVASFSPIASNAKEDGRAKNRRVELVVQ